MMMTVVSVTGRSSAWLERTVRVREVGGSNPLAPTFPKTRRILDLGYPSASEGAASEADERRYQVTLSAKRACIHAPTLPPKIQTLQAQEPRDGRRPGQGPLPWPV